MGARRRRPSESVSDAGEAEGTSLDGQPDSEAAGGEAWTHDLVSRSAVGIFMYRRRSLLYINPAGVRLTGYSLEQLKTMRPSDVVHPEDWPRVEREERRLSETGRTGWVQFRIVRADGEVRWVTFSSSLVEAHGRRVGVATVVDITERVELEQRLAAYREWLELAQRAGRSIAWEWRPSDDAMLTAGSPADLFGVAEHEIPSTGNELLSIIPEEDRDILRGAMRESARTGGPFVVEHRIAIPDREPRWLSVRGQVFRHESGRVDRVVGVSVDVTRQKQVERERAYLATHDPLTGLRNRREFELLLEDGIRSARDHGENHAFCYVDLDDFKLVNDACGHTAGDHLLRGVASALAASLDEGDVIGRLGGDEFGAFLHACSAEDALEKADRLLHSVRTYPFRWEDRVFEVGASIGIALITRDAATVDDIMQAADRACYVAKERGRNRVHVYQPDDADIADRAKLADWIRVLNIALRENRFRLYGQPIRPLAEGRDIPMVEVLLRLFEPDGRLILPEQFVPAAESARLMPRIDRWVVRETLRLAERARPLLGTDLLVTINLSGASLSDPAFMDEVSAQLQASSVPAEGVCFEITETAAIADLVSACTFMDRLRGQGCRFILDDFGSGLSSFTYLRTLPVQFLKIDGALVRHAANDPVQLEMVEAIHRVGVAMSARTIGEAVESEVVLEALRACGVHYGQGYHLGRPRPLGLELSAHSAARQAGVRTL